MDPTTWTKRRKNLVLCWSTHKNTDFIGNRGVDLNSPKGGEGGERWGRARLKSQSKESESFSFRLGDPYYGVVHAEGYVGNEEFPEGWKSESRVTKDKPRKIQ